jgi:hypothetical protein
VSEGLELELELELELRFAVEVIRADSWSIFQTLKTFDLISRPTFLKIPRLVIH